MNRFDICEPYLFDGFLYPWKILPVNLNKVHLRSTGREFKTDAACSWKKIQNGYWLKINSGVEDIEQAFTSKIRCWSGLQPPGRNDYPSLVSASDYSQFITVKRL